MGFTCQAILEAKKILQKMRTLNLRWDDEILKVLQKKKTRISGSADCLFIYSQMLPKMAIYVTCSNIELVFTSRIVRCWFLVGRSRSPPVRPISIPRRALPAATLSMKIYTKCSWMSG